MVRWPEPAWCFRGASGAEQRDVFRFDNDLPRMPCCPLATAGFGFWGNADTSRDARSIRPDLARFKRKGRQTAFLGECRQMSQVRREDAKGPPGFRRNALVADFL